MVLAADTVWVPRACSRFRTEVYARSVDPSGDHHADASASEMHSIPIGIVSRMVSKDWVACDHSINRAGGA